MLELIESVKKHGVLVPAIARPKQDGGYELVAGHRRQRASQLAGLDSMPVIVMNLDDNDTIIQLVDSNIQRENILPSERAKAYKLRMEAVKKKAGRPQKEEDQNSPKISANFRSDDSIGELAGVSGDTIRNYISLTNLIPELMEMVDEKKIALSPAYQIAALPQESQNLLYDTIESEQATPSLSQAQRIRKLSQSGKLNEDSMLQIIISRCIYVGIHCHDYMRRLVCFGAASSLMFQVLINVGMCIGVMPVIGLTMPLISYGGSSVVTIFAMLGLVSGAYARPQSLSYERYIQPYRG